jgi:hypothetical protein
MRKRIKRGLIGMGLSVAFMVILLLLFAPWHADPSNRSCFDELGSDSHTTCVELAGGNAGRISIEELKNWFDEDPSRVPCCLLCCLAAFGIPATLSSDD